MWHCLSICNACSPCSPRPRVQFFNLGSSAWDTCATEAVLRAAGGQLTTLFGWPAPCSSTAYRRNRDSKGGNSPRDVDRSVDYANRLGVFATAATFTPACGGLTHDDFCRRTLAREPGVLALLTPAQGELASESEVEVHAIDVARSIWGEPFTVTDFERVVARQHDGGAPVAVDGSTRVLRYRAPESAAVRYKQSHACRLEWTDATGKIGSAFLKRIVMRELPSAVHKLSNASWKLVRDIKGNANEAWVLGADSIVRAFNTKHSTTPTVVEIVTPYVADRALVVSSFISSTDTTPSHSLLRLSHGMPMAGTRFGHIDSTITRSTRASHSS